MLEADFESKFEKEKKLEEEIWPAFQPGNDKKSLENTDEKIPS